MREETGVPPLQFAHDLGVNKGNLNACCENEDPSKYSLETAIRVMKPLKEIKEDRPALDEGGKRKSTGKTNQSGRGGQAEGRKADSGGNGTSRAEGEGCIELP